MEEDIFWVFKEFHEFGSFVKSVNSSFMVLISKVEGTKNIKDFISIIVVESIYIHHESAGLEHD